MDTAAPSTPPNPPGCSVEDVGKAPLSALGFELPTSEVPAPRTPTRPPPGWAKRKADGAPLPQRGAKRKADGAPEADGETRDQTTARLRSELLILQAQLELVERRKQEKETQEVKQPSDVGGPKPSRAHKLLPLQAKSSPASSAPSFENPYAG